MNGYEDIIDNVKTQNGAWMTSWLSDHTEKLRLSIPDIDKDTLKISTWLLILFLRYIGDKIRTEKNKIRTKSIGDMLLCSISPNNEWTILIYTWQNKSYINRMNFNGLAREQRARNARNCASKFQNGQNYLLS